MILAKRLRLRNTAGRGASLRTKGFPFLETSVIAKSNHSILVLFCLKNEYIRSFEIRKNSDLFGQNWTKIKWLNWLIHTEFSKNGHPLVLLAEWGLNKGEYQWLVSLGVWLIEYNVLGKMIRSFLFMKVLCAGFWDFVHSVFV